MTHNKSEIDPFYCEQLDILSKNTITIFLYVFKLFICLLGLIAMILNVKLLGIRWIVHPNARVLYIAVLILSFLICLQYFIMYCIDSFRMLTSTSYCDALISTRLSYLLLTPGVTFEAYLVTIFLFMSIERLIASLFPAYYEKIKSCHFGIFLVVTAILMQMPILYRIWRHPVAWEQPSIAFSIINEENHEDYKIAIYLQLVYEVLSIVTFHYVLIRNRQNRLERYSNGLSVNYQKSENLKMGLYFLPVFYCHFIITVFYMGSFTIFTMTANASDLASYAIFSEYVSWTPLYATAMSLVLYFTKNSHTKHLKKMKTTQMGSVFIPLDTLFTLRNAKKYSSNTVSQS